MSETGTDDTMRAVVQRGFGAADVFEIDEIARPTIAADEVLVRVAAAGLDRGVWHVMTGLPLVARPMFGIRSPRNPVPGLDLAGTVAAVGSEVSGFAEGDEVFGIGAGTFAEYSAAKASKLARRPGALAVDQAAVTLVSGGTALQAVRDHGKVGAGQRVLVTGASGGVGSFAVQIAAADGAEVTGVSSGAKAEFVRSLGAADVIDYRSEDFTALERRWDLIVDIAGNTPLRSLRRALTPEGRLVVVGGEEGGRLVGGVQRSVGALLMSRFVSQELTMFVAAERAADADVLAAMATQGDLTPVVDRTFPLDEIAEAVRHLETGQARGKIAISVA